MAGPRAVVAVVLTWNGRVALFKRSSRVCHDAGLWHCVTGFLDGGTTPRAQAAVELWEEAGLVTAELDSLVEGPVLRIPDDSGRTARPWTVHTFVAASRRRRLRLDWEHDGYRWVPPARIKRFDGQVRWLQDVLQATGVVAPGAGVPRP
jgi:ADP-ribose pyrophosphatase YjhB (NUDIX family)